MQRSQLKEKCKAKPEEGQKENKGAPDALYCNIQFLIPPRRIPDEAYQWHSTPVAIVMKIAGCKAAILSSGQFQEWLHESVSLCRHVVATKPSLTISGKGGNANPALGLASALDEGKPSRQAQFCPCTV